MLNLNNLPFKLKDLPPELLNEQLEFLKMAAAGREDPVFFAKQILGFDLYDEQKLWLWITTKTRKDEVLRILQARGLFFSKPELIYDDLEFLYTEVTKHILATANQIGKTFLTAIKHIWCNYYKIGLKVSEKHFDMAEYKTLNISPHSDQSNKCYTYVQQMLRGELVFYDPETDTSKVNEIHPIIDGFMIGHNDTISEVQFANGSLFYSKSSAQDKGTSRAGEQFGYISYDECAQSLHLSAEIPMLQSRLIRYGFCFDLVSSPEAEKPSHQHYSRLVKKGLKLKDKWYSLTDVALDANVFISSEQKEKAKEEIKTTDPAKYKQMIEGKFIAIGKRFLPMETITQIFDALPTPLKIEFAIQGRRYVMIVDWGMSDTGDPTVIYVLDITDYLDNLISIVYHDTIQGGSPTMQAAAVRLIFQNFGGFGTTDAEGNQEYYPVKLVLDSNSLGGVIMRKMVADLKPIDFTSHGGEKDQMLAELQKALSFDRQFSQDNQGNVTELNPNFGKIRSYFITELEEQLGNYQLDDAKIEQDHVMCLGMGVWYIEKKMPRKPGMKLNLNPLARYQQISQKV